MKNITIVGVGALGSHLIQLVRNLPDVKYTIIDYDKVEMRNVKSQFHAKNSVGKNKTQALSQLMNFCFGIKLETIPHKLNSDNVNEILSKSNLIVDCLDNAETRNIVKQFAQENNIPCVHGALAADGSFGQIAWNENFRVDSEDVVGQPTCEGGEHLPFIGIAAGYLAQSVRIFLDTGAQVGYKVGSGGAIKI